MHKQSTNLRQSSGLGPKIFTYAMAILFVCTTLTIAAQKKSAAAPAGLAASISSTALASARPV